MNATRARFPISVDGGDGLSGYTEYSPRAPRASEGLQGIAGRSAFAAGVGGEGGTLTVMVSPSAVASGGIHVRGVGSWEGDSWECPPGHDLFLSACGGHGGNGGDGEDGQDGGQGWPGEDARPARYATNGHNGENGGQGGHGTSGANGGNGGTIEVSVREEHMYLLVALAWAVDGGDGGAAGRHGRGGAGGPGGDGGAGCTWSVQVPETRTYYDSQGNHVRESYNVTVYHSNPPGYPGNPGTDGWSPSVRLTDGSGGQGGTFCFFVLRRDGTRELYPGCYDLRVSAYDVIDENGDGIFEPGEHAIVRGIFVHNVGPMPSPSLTDIPIRAISSGWLDASVPQHGIIIPRDIPPDGICETRGVMREFIKQEPAPRQTPEHPLAAQDNISIVAVVTELDRALDNFEIRHPIVVQYPLELLQPVYLRTVSIGDEFTVSWTIRNLSNKSYGARGSMKRACCTRLAKVGSFDFSPPTAGSDKYQYIDLLEPGDEATFGLVFRVLDDAEAFDRAKFLVQLLLDEPSQDSERFSPIPLISALRCIAWFDRGFQISPSYSFDPDAAYLLVVNSGTPGSLVRDMTDFVSKQAGLKMDVYNHSISGTFLQTSPHGEVGGENVLLSYVGKTIVLLANEMDYFGEHGRAVYEFMDPWLATRLLVSGTSILLLGVSKAVNLVQSWGRMVSAPELPVDDSGEDGSLHSTEDIATFLSKLTLLNGSLPSRDVRTHTIKIKKRWYRSLQSTVSRDGQKLAKKLGKKYPFQSFAIEAKISTPLPDAESKKSKAVKSAEMLVREGLSSRVNMLASPISSVDEVGFLAGQFEFLLLASLPFERRLALLWAAGGEGRTDSSEAEIKREVNHNQARLSQKARDLLALSVKYDVIKEVAAFCQKAPFRDPASKVDSSLLFPNLTKLLKGHKEQRSQTSHQLGNDQEWLESLLIWLHAIAQRNLFASARGRKSVVRNLISKGAPADFSSASGVKVKPHMVQISKALKQVSKTSKTTGRNAKNATPPSMIATMDEITKAVGMLSSQPPFQDLGDQLLKTWPTFFWSDASSHQQAQEDHKKLLDRFAGDEARSANMIRNIILSKRSKDDEEEKEQGADAYGAISLLDRPSQLEVSDLVGGNDLKETADDKSPRQSGGLEILEIDTATAVGSPAAVSEENLELAELAVVEVSVSTIAGGAEEASTKASASRHQVFEMTA